MESQALLQHDDSPTAILSKKLRTLFQLNALKQGYMPTNEQLQEHLTAHIRSPVLDAKQRGLSKETRQIMDDIRGFLKATGQLLKDKNDGDLIQEIIWNLKSAKAHADVEFDGDVFAARLSVTQAKADAKTAHMKARAVADVLYSNPQFRALLHDGSILARDLLSDVVEATATAIAPEEEDLIQLEEEAVDVDGRAIKDDVDDTKAAIRERVDNVKEQVRETYDAATEQAIATLQQMQEQGQKFGGQAIEVAGQAKEKATKLAKEGSEQAKKAADTALKLADEAIAKLEELTGIQREDIKKSLDNGTPVEDLVRNAKKGGKKVQKRAGELASDAADKVQQGTKAAQDKAAEVADKGKKVAKDAKDKAQDVAEDVQDKAGKAAESAKEGAKDAKKKAEDVAEDVGDKAKKTAKDAKSKADDVAEDVGDKAKKTAKDAKSKAEDIAKDASDKTERTAKDAKSKAQDANKSTSSSNGTHLQQIGIVHDKAADKREAQQQGGKGKPDPDYTFDEEDTETDDALAGIMAQIRTKTKGQEGITEADMKRTARKLLHDYQSQSGKAQKNGSKAADKTKETAKDAKAKAGDAAESAKQKGSEVADEAVKKAEQAKEKGSELADKAQKKGSEVADEAGKKAEQAKQKGSELADKAQKKGSEVADEASKKAEQAKEKGAELADKAQKKGSEIADEAGKKAEQAKKKGSELADQASEQLDSAAKTADDLGRKVKKNADEAVEAGKDKAAELKRRVEEIDQEDIQKAIDDLIRATKQKLTEVTGITEDDVVDFKNKAVEQGKQARDFAVEKGKKAAETAEDVAVNVGAQAKHALQNAPRNAAGQIHDTLDAAQELTDATVEKIKESTKDIREYLAEKFPPKRRQALQKHFTALAVSLRDNTDYSNGLDGLIPIGRKYVDYTMTFVDEVPDALEASANVDTNNELDVAVRNTITLIERFSNGVGFGGIQKAYKQLKGDMGKDKHTDEFLSDCMTYFKRLVQDVKYAASDDAQKHGQELLDRINEFTESTGFKDDVNDLIRESVKLAEGFTSDQVLLNWTSRGRQLFKHLTMNSRGNFVFKTRVIRDFFQIIMPSALKLVQYVPISRVEFQNEEIDLVVENLVFESSASHDQSFLPYRMRIMNKNVFEAVNAYKYESAYSQRLTVKLEGLTMAVRDAGFYIRKKTGFFRFYDSGLFDVIMDGPGVDIEVDLQMSTEDEEEDVTRDALFVVKAVRVDIRKFDFSTSGARHGWLIGLFKPLVKGFVKRQIETAIADSMKEQLVWYEYQLRMLQHRVKTAFIANNGQASFASLFRAITTGYKPNPGRRGQFEVAVGTHGPLRNVHTKASLEHELEYADEIVDEEGRRHSWKNDIFSLGV
ncbi:hypothetical protein BCR37DRAFT_395478 [Protomyces lactucae-debilis]|uniref:HAM1-like N-terminal domain-containing protein n=1 Tax=Protomyces lactucae-debilis TaxID=2754530 RepID=A0A1Y2EW18_PROLT|nr:uncharacterized protein BCR37DRAFT_395478 [Protomyces lactucae-debilis]ORY75801.1 hypothetical protein BCR37DRAFT_395478 [Protomyces lactucae-debilis]